MILKPQSTRGYFSQNGICDIADMVSREDIKRVVWYGCSFPESSKLSDLVQSSKVSDLISYLVARFWNH